MLSLPLHVISPSIQVSNQELAHQQIAWLDYYDYRVVKNTNAIRDCLGKHSIFFWAVISPAQDHAFSWYTCVCWFCLQCNEQIEMKNKLHCKSLPSWSPHHEAVKAQVARVIIITIQLSSLSRRYKQKILWVWTTSVGLGSSIWFHSGRGIYSTMPWSCCWACFKSNRHFIHVGLLGDQSFFSSLWWQFRFSIYTSMIQTFDAITFVFYIIWFYVSFVNLHTWVESSLYWYGWFRMVVIQIITWVYKDSFTLR